MASAIEQDPTEQQIKSTQIVSWTLAPLGGPSRNLFFFPFHIRMILFAISHHDRQKLLEGTYYQLWYYPSSRKMWAKGDSQPPPFFCLRWKGIPMIQLVLIKTCLSKQRVAVLGVLTSPMDRSIKRQIADPLGFECLRVPH